MPGCDESFTLRAFHDAVKRMASRSRGDGGACSTHGARGAMQPVACGRAYAVNESEPNGMSTLFARRARS